MKFEDFFKIESLPIQNSDKVYYSSQANRFFQIKSITDDYYICGGFSEYYSDAMTNIQRQQLSYDFIKKCILAKQIDKFAEYNRVGWKVKDV